MSYSKANVLTLCGKLSLDLEDSTTIDDFFDEVVYDLALLPNPVFTDDDLVSLTSGTATYSFETGMVRLLHAIMEDASIFLVTDDEISSYSNEWLADTGTPIAATQDELLHQYTLYPIPDFNSGAVGGGGQPLGEDYPDDQLYIYYSEYRSTSIQEYYGLPIALRTLAREFSFASLHTDDVFSDEYETLSSILFTLLGH